MEEENLKKYLFEMNRAIRSGNPRFMSYVSREYMKYQNTSPIISEAIRDMIVKEVNKNEKSPYAVFLDSDGSVSLESMSDISKISNISQFISQVQELSKYNINFENMTSDDLILESDRIAGELEKEVETDLNKEDITEEDVSRTEKKAENTLVKLGILATIGGTIGGAFKSAISKIREKMSGISGKKKELAEESEINEKSKDEIKQTAKNNFDDVCPRVDVDELGVINNMKKAENKESIKNKNTDTYGDGDPDGDDISL